MLHQNRFTFHRSRRSFINCQNLQRRLQAGTRKYKRKLHTTRLYFGKYTKYSRTLYLGYGKEMIKYAVDYTNFIASHSSDPKMKVGCTIYECATAESIGEGYNGNPPQMSQERDSLEPGKSGFLHAEVRAALSCKSDRNVKKEVYVNLPPCLNCAKVLLELGGVCKLYFKPNELYSDDGIKLLQSVGIECLSYEGN